MTVNGRRAFLKMIGLGGSAVVLGSGAKALADKNSDEVIQEGADQGLYSQEIADEVINEVQYEEPRKEPQTCAEWAEDRRATRSMCHKWLVDYNYSQRLEYELFAPFKKSSLKDVRTGDHLNVPQIAAPKVRKKELNEALTFDSIVNVRQFETQHFYDCFVIRDEEYTMQTPQRLFELFCEPAIISLGRHLNESGFKHSFDLEEIKPWTGCYSRVHTSGSVPVRATVQYDIENMGHRVSLEVLVA